MIKYFVARPIAIILIFTTLVFFGILSIYRIPLSLLPNNKIPQLVISLENSSYSALFIEKNICSPLREELSNLENITSLDSRVSDHFGYIYIEFKHGTNIDLAIVRINERIDKISERFPKGSNRPYIHKVDISDIPIIKLNVVPSEEHDFSAISLFVENTLRSRLLQINGVGLVELNGISHSTISIRFLEDRLKLLSFTTEDILSSISKGNGQIDNLYLKDGQYEFSVSINHELNSLEAFKQLSIINEFGISVRLDELAEVKYQKESSSGLHLFNGKRAIAIAIHKTENSRIIPLIELIRKEVNIIQGEYKNFECLISQDQTYLINAGIDNLNQDLLIGGILTIGLLFLFLGSWREPLLMSINIPLSLIISFLFFYIFDISINIISLSGLALGIGMVIDNSIVVIESINRHRLEGNEIKLAIVLGGNRVFVPVLSQVLTTVAVYLPLIILNDLSGSLILEQCIALTISLAVSLSIAFILTPVLYNKVYYKTNLRSYKTDTRFYLWIEQKYHSFIDFVLDRKWLFLVILILVLPLAILFGSKLEIDYLPKLERTESLLAIEWNNSLNISEMEKNVRMIETILSKNSIEVSSDIGISQLMMNFKANKIQRAEIYYKCKTNSERIKLDKLLSNFITQQFSDVWYKISSTKNSFTQLFDRDEHLFEARFYNYGNETGDDISHKVIKLHKKLNISELKLGESLSKDRIINMILNYEKMHLFGIKNESIERLFSHFFSDNIYGYLNNSTPIKLDKNDILIDRIMKSNILSTSGVSYPISEFVTIAYDESQKSYFGDKNGTYHSIYSNSELDYDKTSRGITQLADIDKIQVLIGGQYEKGKIQTRNIFFIFLLVVFLLYFILCLQYESLTKPFFVLVAIPIGLVGSTFLLGIAGGTINVMSAIGFIIVLGLVVDDPILKLDVINNLEKEFRKSGQTLTREKLRSIIHEAGYICLKPMLLVSFTTSMALIPVLFLGGIGNELQRPVALVVIGGLTIGTFFSTWIIPLLYWISKRKI